jgi:hypothetical protein
VLAFLPPLLNSKAVYEATIMNNDFEAMIMEHGA